MGATRAVSFVRQSQRLMQALDLLDSLSVQTPSSYGEMTVSAKMGDGRRTAAETPWNCQRSARVVSPVFAAVRWSRLAQSPATGCCITRDTIDRMGEVSIRDLRNHGGDVVDRAARGEQITITRSGKAVAELRAISPRGLSAEALLSRWRRLPSVDPVVFRDDVDRLLDSSL